jgi:hypothetical protein
MRVGSTDPNRHSVRESRHTPHRSTEPGPAFTLCNASEFSSQPYRRASQFGWRVASAFQRLQPLSAPLDITRASASNRDPDGLLAGQRRISCYRPLSGESGTGRSTTNFLLPAALWRERHWQEWQDDIAARVSRMRRQLYRSIAPVACASLRSARTYRAHRVDPRGTMLVDRGLHFRDGAQLSARRVRWGMPRPVQGDSPRTMSPRPRSIHEDYVQTVSIGAALGA